MIRAGREGGAVASGINAQMLLAFDDFGTGQWEEAQQLLDEAVQVSEAQGYRLLAWPGRQQQARSLPPAETIPPRKH